MKIELSTLPTILYVDTSFKEKIIFDIQDDEIELAINQGKFEQRGFQTHIIELKEEWNRGATPQVYLERHRNYHVMRIAYFVKFRDWNKVEDPITLTRDPSGVIEISDGLHRIKAAKFLKHLTIDAIFK